MSKRENTGLLQAVIVGTGLFGAVLVLLPGVTRAGFAWLMFGDRTAMDTWPPAALGYVGLLHGVLGAVMVGWALALLWAQRAPPTPQGRWRTVAVSVGAWYLIDTSHSAAWGAWPNVVLNTLFGLAFALALWRAWPQVERRAS